MSNKCVIYPKVRNENGEFVESSLFKDLWNFTGDRSKALNYYAVTLDKEFRDKYYDSLEHDSNGEVTFKALNKVFNIEENVDKEKSLNSLNSLHSKKECSFNDAISTMQTFNKNSQFNDGYMATIKDNSNGTYDLSIVKRTAQEEKNLEELMYSRNAYERLVYRLQQLGVNVDIIKPDNPNFKGMYSTLGVDKMKLDGLVTLITLAEGNTTTATLAEETGHFIVSAMKNDPLMQRFESLFSNNVIESVLEKKTFDGSRITNSKREAMGIVIGEALVNELESTSPFKSLCNRIISKIKNLVAKLTNNDVLKAKLQAEYIAKDIARGFMSSDFTGTIEEALQTEETLFSAKKEEDSNDIKAFKELNATITNLRKVISNQGNLDKGKVNAQYANLVTSASEKLTDLSEIIADYLKDIYDPQNSNPLTSNNALTNSLARDAIYSIFEKFAEMLQEDGPLMKLLDTVDIKDTHDFYTNLRRNASTLATVSNCLKYMHNAAILLNNRLRTNDAGMKISPEANSGSGPVANALIDACDQVMKVCSNIEATRLFPLQVDFFTSFLTDSYGKDYIETGKRILFGKALNKKGKRRIRIISEEARKVTIASQVSGIEDDISLFERFGTSMSNNADFICQIADKICKEGNKLANDRTEDDWRDILSLKSEFEKLKDKNGNSPRIEKFIEKYPNGKYSHAFLSPIKYGQYYTDIDMQKKQWEQEFKDECEQNGIDWRNMDNFSKGILYNKFLKDRWKLWHTGKDSSGKIISVAHSIRDKTTGKYIPNPAIYSNPEWDNLSYEEKMFANKLVAMKDKFDRRLPNGASSKYLLPQFKGRYINRVKVKMQNGMNVFKATGKSLLEGLRDTFCEVSTDEDYGCDDLFYRDKDSLGNDAYYDNIERVNRLPIYGISRMVDRHGNPSTDEMSTDIFASLLAYSAMSNKYSSVNSVVDCFALGKTVLHRRKTGSTSGVELSEKVKPNKVYARYVKYIDKQVYGINNQVSFISDKKGGNKYGVYIGRDKILVDKVMKVSTKYAMIRFLAGNLHGALVNAGTGHLEILKESLAGEHITLVDMHKAVGTYIKYCPENWKDDITGNQLTDNKLALLHRRWNITGNNDSTYRSWDNTVLGRLHRANPLSGNLMWAYGAGDHYMQSIAYIAMAQKTKLVDDNGKEISLWEAYKVSHTNPKMNRLVLAKDAKLHDMIYSISTKIANVSMLNKRFSELEMKNVLTSEESEEYNYLKRELNLFRTGGEKDLCFTRKEKEWMQKNLNYVYDYNGSEEDKNNFYQALKNMEIDNEGFYLSKEHKIRYDKLKEIFDKTIKSASSLTDEELDLIADLKVDSNGNPIYSSKAKINLNINNFREFIRMEMQKCKWNETSESVFMDKCRDLNNRLHGIYNKQDRTALQDNIFGQFILSMRGYAFGFLESHFGKSKYRLSFNDYKEGKFVTAAKVFCSAFMHDSNCGGFWTMIQAFALLPITTFLPSKLGGNQIKQNMINAGFGEFQYYNMKRFHLQILTIAVLMLTAMAFLSRAEEGPDDDDDEYNIDAILAYFFIRWVREQGAYTPGSGYFIPGGFEEEAMNIASLSGAGLSAFMSDVSLLVKYLSLDEDGPDKDYDEELQKLQDRFWFSLPYVKPFKVLDKPKKAIEGFEYQRSLKVGGAR